MNFNQQIKMIEERLREIGEDIAQVHAEITSLKKNRLEPSPGLKQQVHNLLKKQEQFLESLELWKAVLKEYPNYDRGQM